MFQIHHQLCGLEKKIGSIVNARSILNAMCRLIQNRISSYLTFHLRPKNTRDIHSVSSFDVNVPLTAIVIQGPVVSKDNFTMESIQLYKKYFDKCLIVLSTWIDSPVGELRRFEALDIEIVLNEKPEYFGHSNINLQIVSSKNGIIRAKELGAKFVLKTRSDQRIYAQHVPQFLYDLIRTFPIKEPGISQKERIIGLSLNTFKYRLYGVSDMFLYGCTEDMLLYWDVPLDGRKFSPETHPGLFDGSVSTLKIFSEYRLCEVFLASEFLLKVGRKLEWTLEDSWKTFANHFCIIDKESLDLYWGKYSSSEYPRIEYGQSINKFEEFTFREWLILYSKRAEMRPSEEILNLNMK